MTNESREELPKGWIKAGLTKFLESIVDYRGATPEKVEDGVFLVTAGNVRNGSLDYTTTREFVREEEYAKIMVPRYFLWLGMEGILSLPATK